MVYFTKKMQDTFFIINMTEYYSRERKIKKYVVKVADGASTYSRNCKVISLFSQTNFTNSTSTCTGIFFIDYRC